MCCEAVRSPALYSAPLFQYYHRPRRPFLLSSSSFPLPPSPAQLPSTPKTPSNCPLMALTTRSASSSSPTSWPTRPCSSVSALTRCADVVLVPHVDVPLSNEVSLRPGSKGKEQDWKGRGHKACGAGWGSYKQLCRVHHGAAQLKFLLSFSAAARINEPETLLTLQPTLAAVRRAARVCVVSVCIEIPLECEVMHQLDQAEPVSVVVCGEWG